MKQIGFYCRTYCSLNTFRAPLCPSSGAQDLNRWLLPVVLWRFGLQVVRQVWSCGLCFRFAGYFSRNIPQTGHITHNSTPDQRPVNQSAKVPQAATICLNLELLMMGTMEVPQAATICINLELLMVGIMVPETCSANVKFCDKNQSVASSWPFISTY